jgi:hypothetical protein
VSSDKLKVAFKEWAVICRALAEGRQALILRKGGIAEAGDRFRLEHQRFWLFPTYTHQQRSGIKPEAMPLLDQVEVEQPPADVVRLSHFAEIAGLYHVHDLVAALILAHLHLWSEDTVRQRFTYREPGLFVLPVRVWRATQAFTLPNTPAYAGCRTWVELDQELPTADAVPVLEEEAFRDLLGSLDRILNPTALA